MLEAQFSRIVSVTYVKFMSYLRTVFKMLKIYF